MVSVIRGAITLKNDSSNEMILRVKELMDAVFMENRLQKTDVKCIVFSVTSDIHAFHPAKACRMAGYFFAPLFCTQEPDINGGLKLCVRVMVMTERETDFVKHIYLEGATVLREDISSVFNVALDGPAGSGKSTIAKCLAEDYNILYLDTGAMYRACALYALRKEINPKDRASVDKIIDEIPVEVKYEEGTQHTYLADEDVSKKIRQNEVSLAASDISAHPSVRQKMVEMQRKIAKTTSCVLDGRDIGTAVLPDAKFKFYITADSKVRAKRRVDQLLSLGQTADFDAIHKEILLRDKQDSEREFSPLKKADDAVLVDTSSMTIEEVQATIKRYIQERI